jgi:ferredoxin
MTGRTRRALLIVFSGTGNTLRVTSLIKEEFARLGWHADIHDITSANAAAETPPVLDGYDLIGLGYPVYAFNAPAFFRAYVKRLALHGKTVFIFKTSGEPTFPHNASSWGLMKLLKECVILGDYHFLMPYNIIVRFPDALVRQMYRAAKKISRELAARVTSAVAAEDSGGTAKAIAPAGSFIPITFIGRVISFVFKIQAPGSSLNGILYSVNRKKCTRCGLCARACPAQNITIKNGTFHFGWKCLMCMRCSFFCPADAIRIGFLNLWRINGAYTFDEESEPFITERTKGLYRIYLPWFKAREP